VFAFHFSRLALFVHQAYVLYIMDCNPVVIDLAAEKLFTVEASPPYAAPRVHQKNAASNLKTHGCIRSAVLQHPVLATRNLYKREMGTSRSTTRG
jgi:hypothetical protein